MTPAEFLSTARDLLAAMQAWGTSSSIADAQALVDYGNEIAPAIPPIAPGTIIQLTACINDVIPGKDGRSTPFSDPFHANIGTNVSAGILRTWSGGCFCSDGKFRFYGNGGGNTYGGTEGYAGDPELDRFVREIDWTPVTAPDANGNSWPDQSMHPVPASRHTYDTYADVPELQAFFYYQGNVYNTDQARDGEIWRCNYGSLPAWPWAHTGMRRPSTAPSAGIDSPSQCYIPYKRKLMIACGPNGYWWADPFSNTVSTGRQNDAVLPGYPIRQIPIGTDVYWLLSNRSWIRWPLNPASAWKPITLTGPADWPIGCGAALDPVDTVVEMWNGADTFWRIAFDAVTNTGIVTKIAGTLANPVTSSNLSLYGRYAYWQKYDCMVGQWSNNITGLMLRFLRGSTTYVRPDSGSGDTGGSTTPPPSSPSIASFTVTPSTLPSTGGRVTLAATGITNADTITFAGVSEAIVSGAWSKLIDVNASQTFSITVKRASDGASATKSCAVTVAAAPPTSGGPINPSPGSARATVTTMPLGKIENTPQNGVLVAASNPFGASKHTQWVELLFPDGTLRLVKACGDHACIERPIRGTMTNQGGQQTIVSLDPLTNRWRFEWPYYDPNPAHVQSQLPDDGFAMKRLNEVWVANCDTNSPLTQYPAGIAKQLWRHWMPWSPDNPAGWRDVGPLQSLAVASRAWGGAWYAKRDVFFIPSYSGYLNWLMVDGKTGANLTKYSGTSPLSYGSINAKTAGLAIDDVTGDCYFYDHATCNFYRTNCDALLDSKPAMQLVCTLPDFVQGGEGIAKIAFDPAQRIVYVNTGKRSHAYEIERNLLTSWDRLDGAVGVAGSFLAASGITYSQALKKFASVGWIDWGTSTTKGFVGKSWWVTELIPSA